MKIIWSMFLHQPFRLKRYTVFDIGRPGFDYFDEWKNRYYFERAANKSYIPMLSLLTEISKEFPEFRVNLSFSGTWFEQAKKYKPEVIDLLHKLYDTGSLEFIGENYYHSLAFLISEEEFSEQIKMHRELLWEEFGAKPVAFRNTEASYCNWLAKFLERFGYKIILTEYIDWIMGWRGPTYVYKAKGSDVRLVFRHYRLSDDISFRFHDANWEEYPLTADKYAYWIASTPGEIVVIYQDFETYGEHQWKESGIFEFVRWLPREIRKHKHLQWANISEVLEIDPKDEIDIPNWVSWADMERDLSAWLGNKMQHAAFEKLKSLEKPIKELGDKEILEVWRKLTTSDHLYYISTKGMGDGTVHHLFRGGAYETPYDAFANLMNVLSDLEEKVKKRLESKTAEKL